MWEWTHGGGTFKFLTAFAYFSGAKPNTYEEVSHNAEKLRDRVLQVLSTKKCHQKLWDELATFYSFAPEHWYYSHCEVQSFVSRESRELVYICLPPKMPSPTEVIQLVRNHAAYLAADLVEPYSQAVDRK
jgi:hypothetical protein